MSAGSTALCQPCYGARSRNRAAMERADADRELLALVNAHPMSEVAQRLGVSTAAVSKRVKAATKRQDLLRRLREQL